MLAKLWTKGIPYPLLATVETSPATMEGSIELLRGWEELKTETDQPYDLTVPCLGMYQMMWSQHVTNTRATMSLPHYSQQFSYETNPSGLTTEEWVQQKWYMHAIEWRMEDEGWSQAVTGRRMWLEGIRSLQLHQSGEDKWHVFSHLCFLHFFSCRSLKSHMYIQHGRRN